MAKGVKTGGRVAGTPNKATSEVAKIIDQLCGPNAQQCFDQLAAIAVGKHDNVKARLVANQTLLAYRHGKPREMVELTGAEGGALTLTWQS